MSGNPFGIPEPKMPTAEEHRAVSLRWLERVQPTLIDQWPAELAKLSFPTEMVQVPVGDLWDDIGVLMDGGPMGRVITELADDLDARMGWQRKFVRLNSRSPKDYPWPFVVPATISGKEAMHFLTGSMRVVDDLYEFKWVPEQPCFICLREWQHDLRSEHEYRCFVKDGELIAVTAYDYTKPQEMPEDGGKEIRDLINAYFTHTLKPVLHLDTVVFDLWLRPRKEPELIEINAYGLSDPCFFGSYLGVENAGSFVQYSYPPLPTPPIQVSEQ